MFAGGWKADIVTMIDEKYVHPAFPQPQDQTTSLWRYMDAPKFEWLVENQRLFMPSAAHLGDPLEGSTPRGELEWWRRKVANADTEEHRQTIAHNRALLSRFAERFRDHYYVSCWHMNEHENHAMWGCYTAQAKSVAIWTSYEALQDLLPSHVQMGIVRYTDYATGRLPTMNMFEYIMHKDIAYSFEQEVRAVGFPPAVPELGAKQFHADLFELEAAPGFIVCAPSIDLTRLIQGLFLHPEASPAFESHIADLCARNGLFRRRAPEGTMRPYSNPHLRGGFRGPGAALPQPIPTMKVGFLFQMQT